MTGRTAARIGGGGVRRLGLSLTILAVASLPGIPSVAGTGPDCNGNGVPDDVDILAGTSQDCDGNGIPDECDTEFVFEPLAVLVDLQSELYAVVAADVDGDGVEDYVFARESSSFGRVAWASVGSSRDTTVFDGSADVVHAADLDGDGDTDVVSGFLDRLSWHENLDGSGAAWQEHPVAVPDGAVTSVDSADLDGDGDRDVVLGTRTRGEVAWFENEDGAGTFGPPNLIDAATAFYTLSVAAVDVDGDGDADVVWNAIYGVFWSPNDGGGRFDPARVVADMAGPDFHQSMAVADVDGDLDPDIVVVGDTVEWIENAGGAFSAPPTVLSILPSRNARAVAVRDLQGDGYADILFAFDEPWSGGDRYLGRHDGLGGGTFGPLETLPTAPVEITDLDVADLDGDGDVDIVGVEYSDVVWLENASGDCNANAVPDSCEVSSGAAADCNVNVVPDECDIANELDDDCNGNGIPDGCDLAPGGSEDCTENGVPDECEPDCNGNFEADSCDIAFGPSADRDVDGIPDECEPDCNGNRVPDDADIATGTSPDCDGNAVPDECDVANPSLDCNVNGVPDVCDSDVTFTPQALPHVVWGRFVTVADLDGNGFPDVILCGDELGWVRGLDGAGAYGPLEMIDADFGGSASRCEDVVPVDLEGDGDLDLLASTTDIVPDSHIYRFDNLDGAGTFGAKVLFEQIDGAIEAHLDATDVNGDGDLDVAWAWYANYPVQGRILWRENLTDQGLPGVFAWWGDNVVSPGETWSWDLLAADVDGDGDEDLVSAASWFENTGGGFGVEHQESIGYRSLSAADLDLDGDLDVVGQEEWWENLDGLGDFGPERHTVGGVPPWQMTVADLDGDDLPDLLSSDGLWYEHLDTGVQFGFGQPFGPEVRGVTAADLDRDGDLDVVAIDDFSAGWYRNDTPDCDGSGVPDSCEALADCDDNGVPDTCEIRTGVAADECSTTGTGNGLLDVCEADCDHDGMIDSCGAICPTCDVDGDNCLDELDCSESDPDAWSEPSAAGELVVSRDPVTLTWQPGPWPGAAVVRYDVLRSLVPDEFHAATVCVETDDTDTTAEDADAPDPGETFHYLVRTENDCPGPGNLGQGSGGSVRSGVSCF